MKLKLHITVNTRGFLFRYVIRDRDLQCFSLHWKQFFKINGIHIKPGHNYVCKNIDIRLS